MGVMFEYTGVVKKVKPLQTFDSGFSKREVIVTDDVGAVVTYPNIIPFVFKKDRVSKLDNVQPGMRVKIVFAIDGREWTDSSGVERCYTDLTGLKLDILAGGSVQEPSKPLGTADTSGDGVADDTPF